MKTSERIQPVERLPEFSENDIEIPYTSFTLPNGLRLIVHEDHKAPIVAVNVWYHVGSKNEKPHKSGFAHLFEHLMFNGSAHFNDDYFQALLGIGATDLNGTTNQDRTNYFQNVPTAALDQVLWLESDRMGHLLGALDQSRLDEQRGVVINEKKQGENVPYGSENELVLREMFPPGHPYSWTVIGATEDLEAATLEDFREWFSSYYGAANAVLVIAGDVEPQDVLRRVTKYFGDIPPGPPITRPGLNIPIRHSNTRASYQDRVPEARVSIVWNSPQLGSREDAMLSLAAAILSSGKTSRLYKSLVYTKKIASSVSAFSWSREIAGNFVVSVNAKPGQNIEIVESEIEKILADFLEYGPTEEELNRVRTQYFAGFIKGLERIGGFGGKSDILASSVIYGGSPDAYKRYHRHLANATTVEIRDTCRQWLKEGRFTLTCHPLPAFKSLTEGADRSQLPPLDEVRAGVFPEVQRAHLDNGLEVILAQRPGSPSIVLEVMFDIGHADDGNFPGLANLAMSMLDEGTASMDALEISEYLQSIGASLQCVASLDHAYVRLSTLKPALQQSIAVFSEILTQPRFPEDAFERLKKEQKDAIQREKVNPMPMALRVLPGLLYGEGHRYAMPLTGSGFPETIDTITREQVVAFYDIWLRPNNGKLIAVGDISMEELKDTLNGCLISWESSPVPLRTSPLPATHPVDVVYLVDRPEAQQSIVIGGYLVGPYAEDTSIATEHMNDVLGGHFISRINLNLREDKHWTYGARSFILDTMGQRPFLTYTSVQSDKTLETIQEIRKEYIDFVGEKPVSTAEFEKNQRNAILALPGQWETNASILASLVQLVKLGLEDDYFNSYPDRLRALSLNDIHTISKEMVTPSGLVWLVVGDRAKVLPSLISGGFTSVIDIDGEARESHMESNHNSSRV